MLREVIYNSQVRLSCSGSLPAEIVLCIPTSIVAPHLCSSEVEQIFTYHYIEATLTAVCKTSGTCNGTNWKYTIEYDDEQLVSPNVLDSTQINGVFCKGCLTQWVEDLVGDEVSFVDNEDGTLTFTSQHGCSYILSIVDGQLVLISGE